MQLLATCQLAQQMGFGAGIYMGMQLVSGQRAYFDEAQSLKKTLRERLLEERVASLARDKEQLTGEAERLVAEKERLEYDRQMAVKFVQQQSTAGRGPFSGQSHEVPSSSNSTILQVDADGRRSCFSRRPNSNPRLGALCGPPCRRSQARFAAC